MGGAGDYSKKCTKRVNTLCEQNADFFFFFKQVVSIFATEFQRFKYDGVSWSLNYPQ